VKPANKRGIYIDHYIYIFDYVFKEGKFLIVMFQTMEHVLEEQ